MSTHLRGAVLVAAMLVLISLPGAVAPSGPTADGVAVIVTGPADVLDDLRDDARVQLTYDWPALGAVAATVPSGLAQQLAGTDGVTVEHDVGRPLLCHTGNGDKGQCGGGDDEEDTSRPTPSDQTPYGIEQIYDDPDLTATSGGSGVVLGHLDTGIDTDHWDLVNRIVFADGEDKNGHGTHTAGTAAADAGSDDLGIYGVAPEASIRSYKVCNNGGLCFTSDIVNAIDACTSDGCDVITYSIGGGFSSSIHDAVVRFTDGGGLFVAAAGNSGPDLDTMSFPASMHETVGVAAIDDTKTVPDFSSRGVNDGDCTFEEDEVELAAAGVDVESTVPDGYGTASGTSMATPHVSGLALKEWAGNGADTRAALHSSVEDITDGKHATTGCDPASGAGLPHAD